MGRGGWVQILCGLRGLCSDIGWVAGAGSDFGWVAGAGSDIGWVERAGFRYWVGRGGWVQILGG